MGLLEIQLQESFHVSMRKPGSGCLSTQSHPCPDPVTVRSIQKWPKKKIWPVATPLLASPWNDVWGFLREGWRKFPSRHDKSEATTQIWLVTPDISMEILQSFLKRHFAGTVQWWSREMSAVFSGYRIYSINRHGRLLNFWTLRVGAYSKLGAY